MVVVGGLFIALLIFYLIFLLRINHGLSKLNYKEISNDKVEFISVVVPFRNESNNIIDNLKSLENQNYPEANYEVIYVDDHSEDDSVQKLQNGITKKNISIKSIKATYELAHKKHAIDFGIGNTKGEIILLTDADCINNPNWISSMHSLFDVHTGLVSGPVVYKSQGKIFENLQSIEFAGLMLAGAGLIGIKNPIICSSANMGFRKSVFNEVGGYSNLLRFSSGDDDLLIQKIAKDTNYEVKFNFSKDALVSTLPNPDLRSFSNQRKRWASKSLFYKNKNIVLQLATIFLFYLGIVAQPILGIFVNTIFFYTFILSLVVKFIFEYLILTKGVGILLDKISIPVYFIAQIFHVPYIIFSSISGAFGKFTWKDRELKR